MKKKMLITVVVGVAAVAAIIYHHSLWPDRTYSAEDFNIETVTSGIDFDGDGTEDYRDIMLGARKDAKKRPRYDDTYYDGGYPPDNIGVCSDVVWRAFKNAGYNLKKMVDNDIVRRKSAYHAIGRPDKNIDFRRVVNLHVFFKKYAITLTKDINDISDWQPGDIVIFENDKHIGIVSDKRNENGQPYIIHNGGQWRREENYLVRKNVHVTGHYRFDASRINENILADYDDN